MPIFSYLLSHYDVSVCKTTKKKTTFASQMSPSSHDIDLTKCRIKNVGSKGKYPPGPITNYKIICSKSHHISHTAGS